MAKDWVVCGMLHGHPSKLAESRARARASMWPEQAALQDLRERNFLVCPAESAIMRQHSRIIYFEINLNPFVL